MPRKWYQWIALYPAMVVACGVGIYLARLPFGKTVYFPADLGLILFSAVGGLVGGWIGDFYRTRHKRER